MGFAVVGTNVGHSVGVNVGLCEGSMEGTPVVGDRDGSAEGLKLGTRDGAVVGAAVGTPLGAAVGLNEGPPVRNALAKLGEAGKALSAYEDAAEKGALDERVLEHALGQLQERKADAA